MARYYVEGKLIDTAGPFKQNHAIGQPVRIDYKDYKVIASRQRDGDEDVDLAPCEVCSKCGGIKGSTDSRMGCLPSFCF